VLLIKLNLESIERDEREQRHKPDPINMSQVEAQQILNQKSSYTPVTRKPPRSRR
jgi:hypothetical protein